MAQTQLNLRVEQPEESIPARVVRLVRQAIMDGSLPPGRRLTERELGDLTGVSRTSIREAITRLQALGLVELGDGRGVRVVVLGRDDVQHIYELREALEAAAVELFMRRASDDEVAEILKWVPLADTEGEERMDMIFHFDELLLSGARNPLLRDTLEPLHARIHALRRLSTSTEGRQAESNAEWVEIAEAIRSRTPEAGAKAVREHVRAAAKAALVALDEMQIEPETAHDDNGVHREISR